MNNLNIPIFRANIENSNNYITGNLRKILTADSDVVMIEGLENLARIGINQGLYKIDETTLAVHFHDMLDSQGNKIFASLSENGKGGDIITYDEDVRIIAIYKNGTFIFKDSMNLAIVPSSRYLRTKVIGIQK